MDLGCWVLFRVVSSFGCLGYEDVVSVIALMFWNTGRFE